MDKGGVATPVEAKEWALGLSSWIIQDGNYGDFRCGQQIEVAVEFGF